MKQRMAGILSSSRSFRTGTTGRNILLVTSQRRHSIDAAKRISRTISSSSSSFSSSSFLSPFSHSGEALLRLNNSSFARQPPSNSTATTKRSLSTNKGETPVVDFFDIFGLSHNFGLELSELKGNYLNLMKEYHPDKQLHNNTSDSHPSHLTAETITHAYQIMKTPHTRALHWLELHGCPLVEERHKGNNNHNGDDAIPPDLVGMEFLMEIMEWREAIEDATGAQPKLEAIAEETKILHQHCERALEDLLDDADANANDEALLQDARQLTAQLQYWHRLETTLKEAMDV